MNTLRRTAVAFGAAVVATATVAGSAVAQAAPARLAPPASAPSAGSQAAGSRPSSPTTGVVVIETALDYQNSAAAGTGVVVTPGGEVLTNNHVIRGATSIRVIVPGSGRRYTARVVGYDVSADVAVLQLAGAGGLATVSLGDSSGLRPGQPVTAVGNAGGTGTLVTAEGTITKLGRSITASDENGVLHAMHGLIQTDAALEPGDSGGPLLDGAGRVIGIDNAASSGFAFSSAASEGYAIPIAKVLSLARQIEAGKASATVHIGPTAFLGVSVQSRPAYGWRGSSPVGGLVGSVVTGGPADAAGLSPGSLITAIGGKRVTAPAAVVAAISGRKPGDAIKLEWYDPYGNPTSATVRLGSGPPQ